MYIVHRYIAHVSVTLALRSTVRWQEAGESPEMLRTVIYSSDKQGTLWRDGKMAQWLRALAVLEEAWRSAPRIFPERLTGPWNSSHKGSDSLYWLHGHLRTCAVHMRAGQT